MKFTIECAAQFYHLILSQLSQGVFEEHWYTRFRYRTIGFTSIYHQWYFEKCIFQAISLYCSFAQVLISSIGDQTIAYC